MFKAFRMSEKLKYLFFKISYDNNKLHALKYQEIIKTLL